MNNKKDWESGFVDSNIPPLANTGATEEEKIAEVIRSTEREGNRSSLVTKQAQLAVVKLRLESCDAAARALEATYKDGDRGVLILEKLREISELRSTTLIEQEQLIQEIRDLEEEHTKLGDGVK